MIRDTIVATKAAVVRCTVRIVGLSWTGQSVSVDGSGSRPNRSITSRNRSVLSVAGSARNATDLADDKDHPSALVCVCHYVHQPARTGIVLPVREVGWSQVDHGRLDLYRRMTNEGT